MDTAAIIQAIDGEISRLTQARELLTGLKTPSTIATPRVSKAPSATAPKARKKRVLSDEARGRIAAAQKKRWAAKNAAK